MRRYALFLLGVIAVIAFAPAAFAQGRAEFDTVAEWTAEVAADLGSAYHIPAGCRGSGTPAALDWLVGHLDLAPGEAP